MLDLDAALRKVNAGYPRTKRHELEWLIRDLVAELRAALKCVDRVRAHVLNDEIYCARCMEDLVAYETVAGLPLTVPEATRTYTGRLLEDSDG